jgi:hypothetical protein
VRESAAAQLLASEAKPLSDFPLCATTHVHVGLSVHPSVWCAERSVSTVVSRADSFRRETLIED